MFLRFRSVNLTLLAGIFKQKNIYFKIKKPADIRKIHLSNFNEIIMDTDNGLKRTIEIKEGFPKQRSIKFCSIRVGENLFKRINKHVDALKKCKDSNYSRSRWINDAIKDKLHKEIQENTISIDKHLNTRIDLKLIEMIHQQVKVMKKFNSSYSKQKWLLEALSEKLEEEEQLTRKRLNELIASSKKNS